MKTIVTFVLLLAGGMLYAQQLVYKPVNPMFGGDTFNYQWLLNSANAQNTYEEESNFSNLQDSELDRFKDGLNRQLLNKVSSDLFREQFGDGDLEPGTYVFGSLVLDISPTEDGLLINILDTQTGDQTQIIIPN